ncbi:hypothetical protein FRC12_018776 [Ceratobasidium sp. 428]|nr:hypothetical protein FRC12_018776 [Ceratobasidium sp. 428]
MADSQPQQSPTRRRTYDYSHQPEQGLQEWASRIKSIQAEVDRDEEAEQKRLEEEIAASRLARAQRREAKRRSSGLPPLPEPDPQRATTPTRPAPASLSMGSSRTRVASPGLSPSRPPADPEPTTPDSPTKPTFGSSRTTVVNPNGPGAPMSLAAFIGGRATGPRLNKPAPQVDSHDSTLFDQTPRTGVSAAAAAFKAGGTGGTGGRVTKFGGSIALPGLGGAGPSKETGPSTPVTEKPVPRSPRSPRSPRAPPPLEPPAFIEHTRKRTLSSPRKSEPPIDAKSDPFKSNELLRSRRKSTTTSTPSPPHKDLQGSPTLGSTFSTPPPRARTKSSTTPVGSPFSSGTSPTLGLARAIQPTPPAQDTKKFPLVTASSPAFRSTQQASAKELSPSLTRLKGRGFVGKVRQAAESSSPSSSLGISSSQFGEREKPKRGNVQERWQMAIQTQVHSQASSPSPSSDVPAWKRRMTKEPVPFPSSAEKPKATPGPSNVFTPKAVNRLSGMSMSSSPVDEFGRRDSSSPSPSSPTRTPEPASIRKAPPVEPRDVKSAAIQPKPLNHLTRDRARKPKKAANVKEVQWGTAAEIVPSTTPVGPPPENRSSSPFKRLRPAISNPSMRSPSPTRSPRSKEEPALKPQRSPSSASTVLPPSPIRKAAPIFTPKPEPDSKGSNVSRVKDMWAERAPIGVKAPVGVPRFSSPSSTGAGAGPSMVGKRALPGMAPFTSPQPVHQALPDVARSKSLSHAVRPEPISHAARPEPHPQTHFVRHEPQPSPFAPPAESPVKPTTPKPVAPASPRTPASPGRHVRTPSTGNRATVMEVAQTMMEKQDELAVEEQVVVSRPRLSPGPPSPSAERRRSSFERHSVISLPTLKEEKTPVPTPAGTISKRVNGGGVSPRAEAVVLPEVKKPEVYRVDQTMAPIPPFNLQQVLNANPYTFTFPSNLKRISTDVFALSNGQATLVSASPCIVYESELVAVVQRVKNERNGLVQSKVWGWQGRKAEPGAREEAKLGELAKQYGTSVDTCVQGEESEELVDAVGGHWITRQGSRAHWTPENTTMHCTRQLGDACFTDEVDFHVANLCSAYSYCITALDAVYVWHGRGSTPNERNLAIAYAKSIAGPEKEVEEFDEGKEDPMFFMLLGEDPWANADYWKYRAPLGKAAVRPRMFCIDAKDKKQPVSCHIPSPSKLTPDSVVVLDGVLELFVVIGSEARARRTDILLGVHVAISIVGAVESQRPFTLPVHLVILPSQMPLDLKAGYFRFLENERVNAAGVPDHMNLLTLQDASEQLSAATWPGSRLQDYDFLPLGLHPSLLN